MCHVYKEHIRLGKSKISMRVTFKFCLKWVINKCNYAGRVGNCFKKDGRNSGIIIIYR